MMHLAKRVAATWPMHLRGGEGDDEAHAAARAGGDVASVVEGQGELETDSARAQQSQLGKANEITHLMLKMPYSCRRMFKRSTFNIQHSSFKLRSSKFNIPIECDESGYCPLFVPGFIFFSASR